jgi:hypothetical protein
VARKPLCRVRPAPINRWSACIRARRRDERRWRRGRHRRDRADDRAHRRDRRATSAAVQQPGAATTEIAESTHDTASGTEEVAENVRCLNRGAAETGSAAVRFLDAAGSLADDAERLPGEVAGFLAEVRAA